MRQRKPTPEEVAAYEVLARGLRMLEQAQAKAEAEKQRHEKPSREGRDDERRGVAR